MKITRREHLGLMAGAAALAVTGSARAESHASDEPMTHIVEMLNADPDNSRERNVFKPAVIRAKVGDTVKFVNADRGHNSQVDDKMMPEGGAEWKGRINEEVEVTFEEGMNGAYGYYCQPHRATGMVGLILVGDVSGNYEDLKGARQRGKAKARYAAIFEEADAILAAESA